MTQTRKRLGRGLDELLSSTRMQEIGQATETVHQVEPQAGRVAEIPTDRISCNPHQPRRHWDQAKLQDLAVSIEANGLLQPILVRSMGDGYQLIAGERRWRASQLAGKETIPAIMRDATEEQMLEWSLVENIHRADLSALERAGAYRQYLQRFSLTQQQAAERLGEDRSTIANYIRLLELPQSVREMLSSAQISMGHARALLALADGKRQAELAELVHIKQLSVRQLECMIQQSKQASQQFPSEPPAASPYIRDLEQQLTRTVGTKVTIHTSGKRQNRGRITIEFYSLDDFDKIRDTLMPQSDRQ